MRKRSLVLMFLFVSALLSLTFFSLAFASAPPGIAQAVPPEKEVPDAEPADTAEISVQEIGGGIIGQVPATRLAAPLGAISVYEAEPNDTPATANALGGSSAVVRGNTFPAGDIDFFSFTAQAGDRVYAATMTAFSPSATDSTMDIYDTDGTTILETDVNDGSFAASSSSIAGLTLPANGTYYIRVRSTSATATMRPYDLYFQLQSGTPVAETEPNNTTDGGQPLPASGWVTGTVNPAADNDVFLFALNAGDTVFLSLDLDPERDGGTSWNGRFGLGAFGNPPLILVVNDANTTSPNSEAFFMTVKETGNYYVYVDHPTAAGTPASTYHLSVSVFPHIPATADCTTYTSTDVPVTIPTGPGLVTSTLNVPGNPRIADLDVTIVLTHTFMPDVDVTLVAPGGNEVVLFADRGVSTQLQMNLTLDDEAAIPNTLYTVQSGIVFQPSASYRLSWFDGQNAGGDWTLNVYDDTAGDGGVLQSWGLTICEPPPPPTCPTGTQPVTVFSTDFEANNGNFTSSGVQDEWQWGTPTFIPITTCNSGANCWVTDLTGTYNASSNQTLLSPAIDLTGLTGPIIMQWAQKYHIESATFDNAFVQVQEVGGANPTRLWDWLDGTMNATVGNPTVTIPMSAGWGERWADISGYAGQSIEAAFNLSSDSSVQLAGLAIDDVTVTACEPLAGAPAISLSKTVGTDPAVCAATDAITVTIGTDVTYCYEVENTGDVTLNVHDLEDSELGTILSGFPYALVPGASVFLTETVSLAATTVNTATWTAYNPTGYTYDDTAPYNFIDISTTGTPLGLTDDGEANVTMPFLFTYYGVTSDLVRIGNNGGILFATTTGDVAVTNAALPYAAHPLAVFPFWDDIDADTGDVYYETQGSAPNRLFIVQWHDRPHFSNSPGHTTFQAILYEGTNEILFQYEDVDFDNPTWDWGASATVGVNENGSNAVQYSFNTPVITNSMAILWTPSTPATASATDTATVTVLAPEIVVDPTEIVDSQPVATVVTHTLTISNIGDSDLNWTIDEAAPVAITTNGGTTLPISGSTADAAMDLVSELGAPLPAGLSPAMPVGGGVVDCDAEPGIIIHEDGTIENGYSGNPATVTEVRFVDLFTPGSYPTSFRAVCVAFISLGPTSLNFDIVVYDDDGAGGEPGTELGSLAATAVVPVVSPPLPPGYLPTWNSYDISSLGLSITSGSVYIGVRYTPSSPNVFISADQTATTPIAGGYWWNNSANVWAPIQSAFASYRALFVRAVEGEPTPCDTLSDISWASVSPTSGTTAAGASDDVTVTFDTTGLTAGTTYTGTLCINSNDPVTPLVTVPLTLTVEDVSAPAISLTKTVGTDAGVCATTDEITVAAGTTVYYCYEVENTGNVTLNLHDLVDDELGAIFTGLPYALTPGSSVDTVAAGLTISATINVTTTNTGTWTAYNAGPSDEATATASATVNVTPIPAPAITIVKTVGTTPGVCATTSTITVASGTTVYYCYTVTNTGNVALGLHDLVDDELGTLVTGLAYNLLPGASVDTVAAGLTVTATITADTTNTATWTAYNAGPSDVATATASATVNVTTVTPSYLIYLPIILKP